MRKTGFIMIIAAVVILMAAVVSPVFAQTAKPRILQKIEDKMGKPLNRQQAEKILYGVQEMTVTLKTAQDKLLKEMTATTGLSKDKVMALIPRTPEASGKGFLEKLEAAMGRPLKTQEKEKVGKSFLEFIMTAKSSSDKFIVRLSEATGLSQQVIRDIIASENH